MTLLSADVTSDLLSRKPGIIHPISIGRWKYWGFHGDSQVIRYLSSYTSCQDKVHNTKRFLDIIALVCEHPVFNDQPGMRLSVLTAKNSISETPIYVATKMNELSCDRALVQRGVDLTACLNALSHPTACETFSAW